MTSRRSARLVFAVGFGVLLLDGAGAVFLGQMLGRTLMIGVGLLLILAAGGLVLAYRRWMAALDAIDTARRDLQGEIARLRAAVRDAQADKHPF